MVNKDQTQRGCKSFTRRLHYQQNPESKVSLATPLSQDGFSILKVCSYELFLYSWLSKSSFSYRLTNIFAKFGDEEGDDATLHLLKFHMHIHRLRIELLEDCLMKMFMASLEGKSRSWYEKLSLGSLYSLKDFHLVFFERYKVSYPYLLLVEDCCKYVESFILNMENLYGDEEFMDEEILEALCESAFQHHEHKSETSCHDKQENLHQAVGFPLVKNGDNQDLNVESHVLPLDNKGKYEDCQSSCFSYLSFSQSLFQEDNIQEVVFLDTLEKQDYIFDQLHEELKVAGCHENEFADQRVEEQDVVPFSIVDNST
jgi:hypothetical protein